MEETPLRNVEVPNANHGVDAGRVAEGTMPDGTNWRISETRHVDAYGQSTTEYGAVFGSTVATVHVSQSGNVVGASRGQGETRMRVDSNAPQTESLAAVLRNALQSGGISSEELNVLRPGADALNALPGRGGARIARPRGQSL